MNSRSILLGVAGLMLFCSTGSADEADVVSGRELTFEQDVRPILRAHCFQCHGEDGEKQGGLDVRLRRFMIAGGESGEAIVPGKPDESYLLDRVVSGEMPPGDEAPKLTEEEIGVIREWIAADAPTARPEPEHLDNGMYVTAEDRAFWSFQPISRPALPDAVRDTQVRSGADAFILQRLREHGLAMSYDATRATFIRRATFDLIGLPPEPADVDRFVVDDRPDAHERLVDRLLASPHYGERWGRHWLDVAGYADSEGYTDDDTPRDWAWKYRDYVINALNTNKPFDRFIVEQLAGDELVPVPHRELSPDQIELLVATGFLRMAPDGTGSGGVDAAVASNEVIADTIEIVSTSLLGLTVGCARCHSHRYDPISQADYYRFRAIFEPALDWKNWRKPKSRLVSLYTDADRAAAADIEKQAAEIDRQRSAKQQEYIQATFERELAKLPAEIRDDVRKARDTAEKDRTDEQKKLLKEHPSVNVTAGSLYLYDRKAADDLKAMAAKATDIRGTKPKEQFVRALTEVADRVPVTHRFFRGDHEQPKETLEPASLTVLASSGGESAIPVNQSNLPTTGRRLAWAGRIVGTAHPLVARVLVNRIWMHHFGRGLVPTPGDFGTLGVRPTHPQLLDWLADEFRSTGWDARRLHRLLMSSTVYRQQLRTDSRHEEIDPDNNLLGGFRLRRLEAEAVRDAVLAVSGRLNDKPFGPAVPVMADRVGRFVIGKENLNAGRPGAVIPMKGEEFRRSVYIQVRRSRPLAQLDTFDLPVMSPNCDCRNASTVAPQSLMLMNSDAIVDRSRDFADLLIAECGDASDERIIRAWKLAYGRNPDDDERRAATAFLADQAKQFGQADSNDDKSKKARTPEAEALATLCQMLMSSNEFLHVD